VEAPSPPARSTVRSRRTVAQMMPLAEYANSFDPRTVDRVQTLRLVPTGLRRALDRLRVRPGIDRRSCLLRNPPAMPGSGDRDLPLSQFTSAPPTGSEPCSQMPASRVHPEDGRRNGFSASDSWSPANLCHGLDNRQLTSSFRSLRVTSHGLGTP